MKCLFIIFIFSWTSVSKCSPASTTLLGPVIDKEMECFSQEKIYHKPTNRCYKLLTKGPCSRGQWFVLEKPKETVQGDLDMTIRTRCVRENCPEGEYYWKETNSCVQAKDKKKLCKDPAGEELLTNVFGEAECVCTRVPPRARLNGDKRKRCYRLYTQGPCPQSQVLGYLSWSEQAGCIPDPCYAESAYKKRNRLMSQDATLAPWKNGTCYELETQGPCPTGSIFKVHSQYEKPECVSFVTTLFQVEKSRNCYEDEEGRCQKQIKFSKNQTAVNFRRELFKRFIGARKRRTTKGGSRKDLRQSTRHRSPEEGEREGVGVEVGRGKGGLENREDIWIWRS